MKNLALIIIIVLASCTAARPLYKTGNYQVTTATKTAAGTTVTFKGVKGKYELHSDTLKVGDMVQMINLASNKAVTKN